MIKVILTLLLTVFARLGYSVAMLAVGFKGLGWRIVDPVWFWGGIAAAFRLALVSVLSQEFLPWSKKSQRNDD